MVITRELPRPESDAFAPPNARRGKPRRSARLDGGRTARTQKNVIVTRWPGRAGLFAARLAGVAIHLQARHPQPGDAMPVDGPLPSEKFLYRQLIASTRLLKAQRTAADGGDDNGLPAHHPPLRIRRW